MQINTKFDVGQEVWFVAEGGIRRAVIVEIMGEVLLDQTTKPVIKYHLKLGYKRSLWVHEKHLYTTKEELVKSLRKK